MVAGPQFEPSTILSDVPISMTRSAQRDQILIGVLSALATLLYVVYVQVGSCPAGLTSPRIAPQNFVP
jgi:hypothetical protein